MFQELQESITGEVRWDAVSRNIYSVDASIFEIDPLCVVLPKSAKDIQLTVSFAKKHNLSIIPRGAGTGIVGGCIGRGIIIDTSKYLNKIVAINIEEEYAIVEPGVIQDDLNTHLAKHGYRLGPNTSTGNRATIGGMVANNAAGSHSLAYGTMVDSVLEIDMILSSGQLVHFSESGPRYDAIDKILKEYKEDIEKNFPKIPRRVSGYNLDQLLKSPNLCKVITGSEGSLGVITQVKVRICKKIISSGVSVLHFENMIDGMQILDKILAKNPIAVEMIDRKILDSGKKSPQLKNKLGWLKGNPEAIFVIELTHDTDLSSIWPAGVYLRDPADIWEVRKAGLGLLLAKRSYNRAIAFIEDITVHPSKLAPFMIEFRAYLKSIGKEAGIYGHVGSGTMHLRPYMDLRDPNEIKLMQKIMIDVAHMVVKHGGSLSGEHGDGLLRSWQNRDLYGDRVYEAFTLLKQAFDPDNLMNPGKVVGNHPVTEDLRFSPVKEIKTFLDFSREGGFSLSADLCNGNGSCRKKSGVMCPSFQASEDEYDSTRARAQTLRGVIQGKPISEEAVQDILELCIECKGCKKECPSSVDMAKMKAELLYQYQEKHGYSLRNRLFASLGRLNRLNSLFPFIYNSLAKISWFKSLLGIAQERSLPLLAKKRFSKMHDNSTENPVVLFSDTYTEFHHPELGVAASSALKNLGYSVIVPSWQCCGRPLISKGFLKQAKSNAEKLINHLYPYAKQGLPIIILEPSCLSALEDDYEGLLGYNHKKLQVVAKACTSFDAFIDGKIPPSPITQTIQLHGHCHQKALQGTEATTRVLNAMGYLVEEIPSGCCGMAGSFGYEKEHYAFSMKIGALKLFPAIRSKSVPIIADGISCRTQIQDGTGRKAEHLAHLVAAYLKK